MNAVNETVKYLHDQHEIFSLCFVWNYNHTNYLHLIYKERMQFLSCEKKPMLTQLKHRETETGEVKCGYRRLSLGAFSHVSTDREPSRLFTMHVKLKQFLKGNLYYKKYKWESTRKSSSFMHLKPALRVWKWLRSLTIGEQWIQPPGIRPKKSFKKKRKDLFILLLI